MTSGHLLWPTKMRILNNVNHTFLAKNIAQSHITKPKFEVWTYVEIWNIHVS